MRIRWMWAVVAFTLPLWGIEAVGKTAADIQRDIPDGVLSDQVRAIMQRITQWHEACTAGGLEAIEKVYPPGKGRGANSDLIAVNSILEATPDWQPSFLAVMWDDSKAQVISHKVRMRGADCTRAITWKLEKLDGTWYLSDQSEWWSLGTFRNQEDFFAMLDISAFMEDYPIGHMWSDNPEPQLRFKTNSRKDEAAAFEESLWPQLDGAPDEVREIAKLVKEWLAAWMAEDMERARAMCTPDALRLFERDRRSNHGTLTGTKGQWFSPMAVKTRPLEAEVISHPMQIELHGFRARMVIQVNLRKVDDRWKIERHSGRQVRGLADSFADFLNRHSDGMIWLDDAAPEWLKLEQQTQTDITIEEISKRYEQCKQNVLASWKDENVWLLPQLRELMLKGSSRQRSELFEFLDRKEIHRAFDESFIQPLTACLLDGNPEVREEALKLGMYPLLADGQRRGEILELMDQLSRDYDHKVRLAVASFMSEYWIPSQEVQEPLAIDIEMRLSKDMFFHEIRNKAVCGLALVKNKSDEVIMRLVDMVPDWGVDLGRIRRGLELGADKEKIRIYLQPYLCLKGRPGDRVKDLCGKIFNEEPSID